MWWSGQTEQIGTQLKPDLRCYLRTARPNIKQQAVKVVVLLPWVFGDFRRHLYLSVPPPPTQPILFLADVMIQGGKQYLDEVMKYSLKE